MTGSTEATSAKVALSESKRALLRQRLHRTRPTGPTIQPLPAGEAPQLSFAQERLWFMEQFVPGTGAYSVPLSLRLRGELELPALRRSLAAVLARHDCLRSRFALTADGSPRLEVDQDAGVPLEVVDLTKDQADHADRLERVERARATVAQEASRPFDLRTGPLLRATVIRIDDTDHVLLVTTHHIVSDGWSTGVLAEEIVQHYQALCRGEPPEASTLPVQYADYAAWQRRELSDGRLDAAREYWRGQLAELGPLELPVDAARGAELTFTGASYRFRLARPLADAVQRLADSVGATLYMALLAGFQTLLYRHCGQREFAVGSPVAGRSLPEIEQLIGLFVNMLPMRADLTDDPTFAELLNRARGTALDAWSHQDLPFEQLVQELEIARDPSRTPVFQTVFVMQDHPTPARAPGDVLDVQRFPFDLAATRYDLELYAFPSPEGVECMFTYNSGLFARQRIEWMAGHFRTLLESAVAAPQTAVSRLDMLTTAERTAAAERNDTAVDLGGETCLHRLVFAQAARTPDAVAVRDARGAATYKEVAARSRRLASEVAAAGVGRDELVAVVMERGVEQVVACLAIQLAGAAYLPIDPELPEQRRKLLLERGQCRLAVSQPWLVDPLAWPEDLAVLAVGDGAQPPTEGVLPDPANPDDLGYVIFTSGSTGEPKGVMIDHRAAVNTVRDINQRFNVGEQDSVLAVSALSFDLSVYDIFGVLAAGGTLVMPEPDAAKDPAAWARWVAEERVTVWDSVPALMELLVEHAEEAGTDISSLRLVMLSGDWIPLDLPDRIRALAPNARVVSLGGATEGSIWSIGYPIDRVDPGWRSIPYGTPLANQTFHILDRHGNPVPTGVVGELHIGGVGVARGYWRDPERTVASFVAHPGLGQRLYRTGDLGRYRPDGVIEFLGRVDAQVKIRGYRIELGEIEAQLATHPGVAEAVVAVRHDTGKPLLVAYQTATGTAAPTAGELRAHLANVLPGYMVPSHYMTLSRLPLTANGKLDRKRLPAPQAAAATGEVSAPRSQAERMIVEVVTQTLGIATVDLDDNFFDIGGHSLAAIQVVTRLRRVLARDGAAAPVFGVAELFRHPTVREFAALIEGPPADAAARDLLHELTPPRTTPTAPAMTYVCVPYGGGQPMAYQPLAAALPADCALYAVAIPGHDPSLPEEAAEPIEEVARRCAEEIARQIDGPLVIYGHCGIGGALAVELAQRLEDAGRELSAVCLGGIFPFARPTGRIAGPLARLTRYDRLGGQRAYHNRLKAMGADLDGLESDQVTFMVRSLRKDTRLAEDYFTDLLAERPARLRAPIISVIGERDPATDYYEERFREWHFLSARAGLVIVDEAGHYFLRYRADELAEILTEAPAAVAGGVDAALRKPARGPHPGWWLDDVADVDPSPAPEPSQRRAPEPSLVRFLMVSLSQLVSFAGTALTDFALPVWIYLRTGSLTQFAFFVMLAIVPGVLAAPLIGALVDRHSKRAMMAVGMSAGGVVQLVVGVLVWTDSLQVWHVYPLVTCLSVALTFHRLGFTSAIPQLAPKQYLGHANGVVQLANGIAQFVAPLAAVALLALIGLGGILVLDVVSFVVATGVLLAIRFPRTMAHTPREPLATEIVEGFRLSLGNRYFRTMIIYFALLNLMLAPLLMSLLPLSLTFGTLSTAGTVAFIGGAGAALGGLVVALWGGPARRRMRGMLAVSLLFGVFGVITGLQPSVLSVGLGAFGLWGTLSVVNGIYLTIIHVKLPHRYHGRVIALNQAIAWSTLPLGFAVVGPVGEQLLDPLMAPDGLLASTVGAVIGTGEGRGLALLFIVLGLATTGLVAAATRVPRLARFDDEVPDADPDDVVGARTLRERSLEAEGTQS